MEKKDNLAKKMQEKIDELQAPCPKDAILQPSNKQVEKWAGQGHMIWKKKEIQKSPFEEIQKSPFDQGPCQKDSEAAASSAAASSSCQKKKKPPSSSSSSTSSASDWGDSSPEPSSASGDPPCQKVELKPCPKVPDPPCQKALPSWVAIDWFQTIEVREGVWDMEALELLKEAGVKVWVISFAGKVQATRVFAKCDWLAREGLVGHVTIVKEKTGPQGKVAVIKRRGGAQHLFDDNWWIIEEAKQAGIDAYGINSRWGQELEGCSGSLPSRSLMPPGLVRQVFAKKTCLPPLHRSLPKRPAIDKIWSLTKRPKKRCKPPEVLVKRASPSLDKRESPLPKMSFPCQKVVVAECHFLSKRSWLQNTISLSKGYGSRMPFPCQKVMAGECHFLVKRLWFQHSSLPGRSG